MVLAILLKKIVGLSRKEMNQTLISYGTTAKPHGRDYSQAPWERLQPSPMGETTG